MNLVNNFFILLWGYRFKLLLRVNGRYIFRLEDAIDLEQTEYEKEGFYLGIAQN